MTQRVCLPYVESIDPLTTEYSIYGCPLDVDRLLARAPAKGKVTVWRQGEPADFGPATTSGITFELFDGLSSEALFRAVRAFLIRERGFLEAASRVRTPRLQRGLTTSLSVRAGREPIGLEIPAALLTLLAARRVAWAFMAWPCAVDGSLTAEFGSPSNNAADEAGASEEASPLISVLGRRLVRRRKETR